MCDTLTNVYIYDIAGWCNVKFADFGSNPMYYADNMYLDGETVGEIVIPDGVTSIPDHAFEGSSINSVTIPNSVTDIGYSAFANCTNLMTATIPNSLTSFDYTMFSGCVKLVEIYNLSDIDISDYSSITQYALNIYSDTEGEKKTSVTEDGFVFYVDGDICYLIGYIGKETDLTLPGDFNGRSYEVYKYAFYGNSTLERVVIPDGVTAIKDYAFYGCNSLSEVVIGKGLAYFGAHVFEGRETAVNVYYDGTSSQWCDIPDYAIYVLADSTSTMWIHMYFYTETELPKNEYYGYWHYDSLGNIVVW